MATVNGVSANFTNGIITLGDGGAACNSTNKGGIRYNSSNSKLEFCNSSVWAAPTGAATPAGSDQQVQINSQGVLYASSGLTYNSSTAILSTAKENVSGALNLTTGNGIVTSSSSVPGNVLIEASGSSYTAQPSLTILPTSFYSGYSTAQSNIDLFAYPSTGNTIFGQIGMSSGAPAPTVNGGGMMFVGPYGAFPLVLQTNNTNRLTILSTGLTGVNTTLPVAQFDVAGEIRTTGNTLACSSTTTGAIRYNSSTLKFDYCGGSTPAWTAFSTPTPAGSDQQVQFNNAGAMGASSTLTFNSSNGQLMAGGLGIFSNSGTASMYLQGSGSPYSQIYLTNYNFGKYWLIQHRADIADAFAVEYNNGSTNYYALLIDPNSLSLSAGLGAGQNLTTSGAKNVLLGNLAGAVITSGGYSVAVGALALSNETTASNDTAIGYDALNILTGSNDTAVGAAVGSATLTTGTNDILIGTSNAVDTPASSTSNFLNIGNVLFATGMTGTVSAPAGNVGIGVTSPQAALAVAGHITTHGTAPASPTSGCGASPTITGTDNAFKITLGSSGTSTTCGVTFNTAWTNPPICLVQPLNSTAIVVDPGSTTTTTMTFISNSSFPASSVFEVICQGYE